MANYKLKDFIEVLKGGGVIVYPTETAYGLGGAATNDQAVKKIFQIKGRIQSKTLPLIVGSLAMAKKWFLFNKKELALAKKFWPGPLTLILKMRRSSKLSRGVIASDRTAAVRVSGSKWVRKLVTALGQPIVSTSANISGQGECYSISAVKKQLAKKMKLVDIVINIGRLPKRAPSTIARVRQGKIFILRSGPVII